MQRSEAIQHIVGAVDSLRATKHIPDGKGGTIVIEERKELADYLERVFKNAEETGHGLRHVIEQLDGINSRIAVLEAK